MEIFRDKYGFANKNNWKVVEFVAVNQSSSLSVTGNVFDGNRITLVPSGPPADFYVVPAGATNYNTFIQGLFVNPKMIRRITVSSATDSYLTQPFEILTFNAFGQRQIKTKFVNTYTNVNQSQSFVNVDFEPDEFIMDNTTYISQYTFPVSSQVSFLVYYQELKRVDMLGKAPKKLMCGLVDEAGLSEPVITEKELRAEEGITLEQFLILK